MFVLVQNMSAALLQMRRAYCEPAITLLPGEAGQTKCLVNPSRRIALEFTHYIGEANRGAKSCQNVNVISHAAHRVRHPPHSANNTARDIRVRDDGVLARAKALDPSC